MSLRRAASHLFSEARRDCPALPGAGAGLGVPLSLLLLRGARGLQSTEEEPNSRCGPGVDDPAVSPLREALCT